MKNIILILLLMLVTNCSHVAVEQSSDFAWNRCDELFKNEYVFFEKQAIELYEIESKEHPFYDDHVIDYLNKKYGSDEDKSISFDDLITLLCICDKNKNHKKNKKAVDRILLSVVEGEDWYRPFLIYCWMVNRQDSYHILNTNFFRIYMDAWNRDENYRKEFEKACMFVFQRCRQNPYLYEVISHNIVFTK